MKKKPIKRVAFVDSFALLNVGDWMEIPVRERTETNTRKAASDYSKKNGVSLDYAFDRNRCVSIVKRLK